MGILIANTDFIGRWKIGQSDQTTKDLEEYIKKYEKFYLVQLLGVELFDLFEADLVLKIPQTQIYIDIYEEFYKDEDHCVYHSQGMKAMVLGFVFYHYVKDQRISNTSHGNKMNAVEVSSAFPSFSVLVSRYNEAVDNVNAIQWYIDDNLTVYPEENLQHIAYTSGI